MALADPYSRPTPSPGAAALVSKTRVKTRAGSTAVQYQRAQVETASPTRLVIMLYEGAIRFCQTAQDAMAQRDLATQHTNLLKAQRILSELLGSLNREQGGEVAQNLTRLYSHMLEQLVAANLYDQIEPVRNVQAMLRDLRASWVEVELQTSSANQTDATTNAPGAESKKPAAESEIVRKPVRLGVRNV